MPRRLWIFLNWRCGVILQHKEAGRVISAILDAFRQHVKTIGFGGGEGGDGD